MVRAALTAVAFSAVAAAGSAAAQVPVVPAPPYYATGPVAPLVSQPANPVEQQILQNYRSQLLQVQRELLQQNPSGLGREQLEINRRLNADSLAASAPPPAAPATAAPPSFNPAPFSASGIVSPPFNAAVRP